MPNNDRAIPKIGELVVNALPVSLGAKFAGQ